jgi:hypothetical protein
VSWIAILVDVPIALHVGAKIVAYALETVWMFRGGGARLRDAYMWRYRRGEEPTREDERALGRPLYFTYTGNTLIGRGIGICMTAPGVVLISMLSLTVASAAPNWICGVIGVEVALLLVFMCAAALVLRAILGPLDRLNPDLGVGSFERDTSGPLYPSPTSVYGRYTLALVACSIVGFTVAYANVSHSAAGAFSGGSSADPFKWLYFTSTLAATLSSSGPSPSNDLARLLVTAQVACTLLVLSVLVSNLLPSELPPKDDETWRHLDGETPPWKRGGKDADYGGGS